MHDRSYWDYGNYRQQPSLDRELPPRHYNRGYRDSGGDTRWERHQENWESTDVRQPRGNRRPNPHFWEENREAGCYSRLRHQPSSRDPPNRGYRPWDQDTDNVVACILTCWDPPARQMLSEFPVYNDSLARQGSCWDPPPRRIQLGVSAYNPQLDYQPPCPYVRPRNSSAKYHVLKREYCRQLPLPDSLPIPLTQSASTHQPQQSSRVIDLGQQRGLPYDPALEVQSLSPVQQAAINDYNEKLRIYRLEQAALLARLNAWFEENIHDENQAEEKTDDNPMIVLGDDTPNDITNVPNDGASLDVPNNESLEEFVKNENESRQVLVEAYDDKVGVLIVPKLEIKDDVETLLEENVVCYEDIIILIESPANRNIGAIKINSNISRSHIMFKCILESWCGLSIQSLIHYPQQPCTFDPGGKLMLSTLHQFIVPTLRTRWISTVGELIRDIFTFI